MARALKPTKTDIVIGKMFSEAMNEMESELGSWRRKRVRMRICRTIQRAARTSSMSNAEILVGLYTATMLAAYNLQEERRCRAKSSSR